MVSVTPDFAPTIYKVQILLSVMLWNLLRRLQRPACHFAFSESAVVLCSRSAKCWSLESSTTSISVLKHVECRESQ